MIFLFTGQPRASKTLNALKFVKEDDLFQGRDVYYYNIQILDHDFFANWKELTLDQALNWFDLPDGSIIVIDEVQKIFPSRSGKDKMQAAVSRLDTHGHNGFDFIFISQHPMLIDTGLRRQVQTHYNFERVFGMESSRRLSWETCIDEPRKDWHARNEADKKRIKFDKKYYGKYKSASIHKVKKSVPKQLYILVFLLIFTFSLFGYLAYSLTSEKDEPTTPFNSNDSAVNSFSKSTSSDLSPNHDYFSSRKPRIEGLPHTAPIYDDLTKPVSFPRISACVLRKTDNVCKCYTQQATPLSVTHDICLNVVSNGYFDHTKVDSLRQSKKDRKRRSPEGSS